MCYSLSVSNSASLKSKNVVLFLLFLLLCSLFPESGCMIILCVSLHISYAHLCTPDKQPQAKTLGYMYPGCKNEGYNNRRGGEIRNWERKIERREKEKREGNEPARGAWEKSVKDKLEKRKENEENSVLEMKKKDALVSDIPSSTFKIYRVQFK